MSDSFLKEKYISKWKTCLVLKKVKSKYNLVEVTDFSTLKHNEVYFCYNEEDARYVVYDYRLSNRSYIFNMCDQETFKIKKNHDMWYSIDSDSTIFRLK